MSKINLLPEEVINKIAAGEVIERPASVVKELIENSLDAQATEIKIDIKDSGSELIKISDNGSGMEPEDALNCLLRHATSKISSAEDLFSISTLGFRGEALSSIAAVSHLSLITKTSSHLEGFTLSAEGGRLLNSGITAAEPGTVVEIRNLFFNTPARKKFLKTDAVELRHIIDLITSYSLLHPEISFSLTHNDLLLLDSPSVKDPREKLALVFGTKLAKEMLELNYHNDFLKVSGFISKPYDARNDKGQQVIFVNGRLIRSSQLSNAVYEGYHSLLFVGKHPLFVLRFELDPQKIDVNVHPQKSEIRIEQIKEVSQAVTESVRLTLELNNLIPSLDFAAEQQLAFGFHPEFQRKEVPLRSFDSSAQSSLKPQIQPYLQSQMQSQTMTAETSASYLSSLPSSEQFSGFGAPSAVSDLSAPPDSFFSPSESSMKIPPLRLLGQVHKTFFLAETFDGIFLIDQHVVQERVLYERFMEQYLDSKVAIQSLLQEDLMEFTASDAVLVNSNLEVLQLMGFLLEPFGQNSFLIRAIPSVFGRLQTKEALLEIISGLKDGLDKFKETQEEIITRMACRASVKAGDSLSNIEMLKLLEELEKCHLPYTCPHGRAILIKLTLDELEKKFRRK